MDYAMTLMFPTLDLHVAGLACLVSLAIGIAIGQAYPLARKSRQTDRA
jgi:hypothetical protein